MCVNRVSLIKLLVAWVLFGGSVHGNLNDYEITCKDDKGQNVDWFYLYKLPGKFHGLSYERACKYFYITSKMVHPQWKLSAFTLNDSESMAGQTITQAYFDLNQTDGDRLAIAYNDEPPNKKGEPNYGHTKGVIAADKRSGFWLVHSVPLYPNISSNPNDYHYPSTGMIYGQSYLCLSLNAEQIDIVGKQLIYNEPQIYSASLPSNLKTIYPNIQNLIQGERINNGPYWSDAELTTLNGESFQSFAKSSKFGKELYEDWIAPSLNTNLFVETWRHGKGNFPSNCTKTTRVWNVSEIKFNETISFKTTDDHSKFGVGDTDSDWICVGDINRAEMQTKRGGGSVCHRSKAISANYRSLVANFEPCPRTENGQHS